MEQECEDIRGMFLQLPQGAGLSQGLLSLHVAVQTRTEELKVTNTLASRESQWRSYSQSQKYSGISGTTPRLNKCSPLNNGASQCRLMDSMAAINQASGHINLTYGNHLPRSCHQVSSPPDGWDRWACGELREGEQKPMQGTPGGKLPSASSLPAGRVSGSSARVPQKTPFQEGAMCACSDNHGRSHVKWIVTKQPF